MAYVEQNFPSGTAPIPEKKSLEIAAAGGIGDALAAAAAVVLAIIGLAGGAPYLMMSIACIAVGVALLFEGGAIAGRYSKMIANLSEHRTETAEVGGGVAAEALAGATGIVLGILALIGYAPLALVAVANIVFGGGLLFGSGATSQMNEMPRFYEEGSSEVQRVTREAVFASAGGQVLIGVGAVVLGILALLHVSPLLLNLIALLGVGGSIMLSGASIGAKMFGVLHRE